MRQEKFAESCVILWEFILMEEITSTGTGDPISHIPILKLFLNQRLVSVNFDSLSRLLQMLISSQVGRSAPEPTGRSKNSKHKVNSIVEMQRVSHRRSCFRNADLAVQQKDRRLQTCPCNFSKDKQMLPQICSSLRPCGGCWQLAIVRRFQNYFWWRSQASISYGRT